MKSQNKKGYKMFRNIILFLSILFFNNCGDVIFKRYNSYKTLERNRKELEKEKNKTRKQKEKNF